MIEINNLTKVKVDGRLLKKVAQRVLEGESTISQLLERKDKTELSIALVSSEEIKKLNKKYCKKDRPTDVLSFTYFERSEKQGSRRRRGSYNNTSGEIVICPEVVKKNAKKFGTKFKKELARVLIHGILHLLGCDHEGKKEKARKMEEKQNYYLKLCQKAIL